MSMTYQKFQDIVDNISKTIKDVLAFKATVQTYLDALATQIDGIGDLEGYENILGSALKSARLNIGSMEYIASKDAAVALATQILESEKVTIEDYIGEGVDATNRIPCYLADALSGYGISPSKIFPKENILMGTVSVAAETPLVAITDPIDLEKYGATALKIKVTTKVENTAGALDVTITGTDANGDPWTGTVSIPDDSDVDTEIDVDPDTADTYCAEVTEVKLGNTKQAGVFQILSKEDRELAIS